MEGDNFDAGSDAEEFSSDAEVFMMADNYDAGIDVEGILPEEFRKYVRDHNLFGNPDYWLLTIKHESDEVDPDIRDKFLSCLSASCLSESCLSTSIHSTGQYLVQFWRAQEVIGDFGERRFHLTTCNQPFIFIRRRDKKTPFNEGIFSYRTKMIDFITGDGGGDGVIGRVFRNKRMECTPNIGYYSYEEYSHRDFALSCHIKSSLVFPLSDSSGRSVGVVEIVSSAELNLDYFHDILLDSLGYWDCCKDISEQYDSLKMAVSEIEEVMQLVGVSCCLVCAQTWMLCNRCSRLSTSGGLVDNLGGFFMKEYIECRFWSNLSTLKKGEGVVGKAATSSHNLVYCDDVSQFGITEYPLAHFARYRARYRKLTACFATCL